MKQIAILILLLVFDSASSLHAAAQPKRETPTTVPPDKHWLACTRNSACSVTWLSCHGWIAINRSHESDVQHWYSNENADLLGVMECTGPSKPPPIASCHANTCTLQ